MMKTAEVSNKKNNSNNKYAVRPNVDRAVNTDLAIPLEHEKPFFIQRTCACGGGCPGCKEDLPIQTKLRIGAPNDKYEQEADRVSEQVMRMPEPKEKNTSPGKTNTDRTKSCLLVGNSEISIQRQKEDILQAKTTPGHTPQVTQNVSANIQNLGGGGLPLPPNQRRFFESRMGQDFSGIRIHTDSKAADTAQTIQAKAFTLGNNIVFNAGQYSHDNQEGKKLLAHELTHVVQQQAVGSQCIQRFEGPEHQDLADKHIDELFDFIQTKEGKKWAAQRKIDVLTLVRQMSQDPVRRDKTIKVRPDLQLTPGQINSLMGDFYETWQALKNASKSEIDKILAVMNRERLGMAKDANKEFETITNGRYSELARKNTKHFAPKNKAAWKKLHLQAMDKAKLSGQKNPTGNDDMYQEALGMDAAAGHFLTDAFASGHLIDSTKVQAAIQLYLLSNPIKTDNPEMQSVVVGVKAAGLAVPLALKNIHDRMNAEGFWVINARGMKWKTYGDNHLKNSVETQRMGALAVFVSRQQIHQARKGGSPNPDEVLGLVPNQATVDKATEQAIDYIPEAVRDISPLINRGIGMLDTVKLPWYMLGPVLPFMGKSVLDTTSDPGRHKDIEDYERRKLIDPTTPYPTPPLGRWNF